MREENTAVVVIACTICTMYKWKYVGTYTTNVNEIVQGKSSN